MKAITICNPYPYFIMLPTRDPMHKRVENRDWPTRFTGPLLIHAGKSRAWLEESVPERLLVFGAIMGVVDMTACFSIGYINGGVLDSRYAWLKTHHHCCGKYCFVLENVRRFQTPIPYKGAQGFFGVPDEVVAEQMARAVKP